MPIEDMRGAGPITEAKSSNDYSDAEKAVAEYLPAKGYLVALMPEADSEGEPIDTWRMLVDYRWNAKTNIEQMTFRPDDGKLVGETDLNTQITVRGFTLKRIQLSYSDKLVKGKLFWEPPAGGKLVELNGWAWDPG